MHVFACRYVAMGCVFRRSDTVGPQPNEVERLVSMTEQNKTTNGHICVVYYADMLHACSKIVDDKVNGPNEAA
jgi:hypothetical protein